MTTWWMSQTGLSALSDEAVAALGGGRVQRVRQAGDACVVVEVHARGTTYALTLDGARPCVGVLSQPPRRDSEKPPAFQGLLRKHLTNTRLQTITPDAAHGVVRVTFATLSTPLDLVVEWGRAANVLLLHHNGVVMGAASPSSLAPRGLRIGQPWRAPSSAAVSDLPVPSEPPIPPDHPLASLPTHARLEISLLGHTPAAAPVAAPPWRRRLKSELDRTVRLVRALQADLDRTREAEEIRAAAERAKVMLAELPRGAAQWELRDPWVPDAPVTTVKVDPALGPQQNVEKLFHRARRLDRTRVMAEPRLAEAQAREREIRELLSAVDAPEADPAELEARATALLGEKQVTEAPRDRRQPQVRMPFRAFRTRDGMRVLVGKTSAENDLLTHRTARGNDVFLHARDAHGSHVILVMEKGGPPPEVALGQAAQLAAHFSEARGHGIVDVRWTEVKHLKKVPGRQGMVTLAKERVRRVKLDDPAFRELLAQEEGASSRVGDAGGSRRRAGTPPQRSPGGT